MRLSNQLEDSIRSALSTEICHIICHVDCPLLFLSDNQISNEYSTNCQNFGFITYNSSKVFMHLYKKMILNVFFKSFVGKFWSYSLIKFTNFKSRLWTHDTLSKNTCFWDVTFFTLGGVRTGLRYTFFFFKNMV